MLGINTATQLIKEHKARRLQAKIASSYPAPELPHTDTVGSRIAATLGLEPDDISRAVVGLKSQDPEKLEDILTILDNDTSVVNTARAEILRSRSGASNLVKLAEHVDDPKALRKIEGVLLKQLKSQLPAAVATLIDNQNWATITSTYQHQTELYTNINIYRRLEAYFDAKHELAISSDDDRAKAEAEYHDTVLDIAELTIDPLSNEILNAGITGTAPAKSDHRNFLENMRKTGSNFEKALYAHLKNQNLIEEIKDLSIILANPLDNSNHPIVSDPNRAGLRISLTNDLLRKNIHRLKGDSVCPGILGRLREFAFSTGLHEIAISANDLQEIYGRDHYNQYLSDRQGYTFRIDEFIIDLYSGSLASKSQDERDPLHNTKAGAVRQLLEAYAVVKMKIEATTNSSTKAQLARQQEFLGTLIRNGADENSRLVPHGVYRQIQHVLNQQTGSILHSLIPISKSATEGTVREIVRKAKERVLLTNTDARTQALYADLEYLEPKGNVRDPKAFTTVLDNVITEQNTLIGNRSNDVLQLFYGTTPAISSQITGALEADPKGNGIANLFTEACAGTVQAGTVDELLANIFIADQRQSRAKYNAENMGTISSLLMQEDTKYNQGELLRRVRDGLVDHRTPFLDANGYDRKLVGISHIFAEIDRSGFSAAIKNEAKQRVLNAVGIDTSSWGATVLTNVQAFDFSTSLGANNYNSATTITDLQAAQQRTLDTLKGFHNALAASKQASSLFNSGFLNHFTTEEDRPNMVETISIIDKAFTETSSIKEFDARLKAMQEHIRTKAARPELADSFDVFVGFDEIDYGNEGSLSHMLNQFLRDLGLDQIAEVVGRLLKSLLESKN